MTSIFSKKLSLVLLLDSCIECAWTVLAIRHTQTAQSFTSVHFCAVGAPRLCGQ